MSEVPSSAFKEWVAAERQDIAHSFLHAFNNLYNTVPLEAVKINDQPTFVGLESEAILAGGITIGLEKTHYKNPGLLSEELREEIDEFDSDSWGLIIKTPKQSVGGVPYWEVVHFFIDNPEANREQAEQGVLKQFSIRPIDDLDQYLAQQAVLGELLSEGQEAQQEFLQTLRKLQDKYAEQFAQDNGVEEGLEAMVMRARADIEYKRVLRETTGYTDDDMTPQDHSFVMGLINYLLKDPPQWRKPEF